MFKRMLSYGLLAGVIAGVSLSVITVATRGRHIPSPYDYVVGYLTMLIALSAVFAAIKRHRDVDLGGVIRFWPAVLLGVGISAIAGICYVLAWEATVAVTHLDFATGYANLQIEQQKANGMTGEALAKFTADMETFKAQYANPFYRLPMTFAEIFPVGVFVSLVSAGLLRNSRFLPARRT